MDASKCLESKGEVNSSLSGESMSSILTQMLRYIAMIGFRVRLSVSSSVLARYLQLINMLLNQMLASQTLKTEIVLPVVQTMTQQKPSKLKEERSQFSS